MVKPHLKNIYKKNKKNRRIFHLILLRFGPLGLFLLPKSTCVIQSKRDTGFLQVYLYTARHTYLTAMAFYEKNEKKKTNFLGD